MKSHLRRDLIFLIALVFVDSLPFLNRAIHLDENTYWAIAHNVFRNFWFPQDFSGLWFGIPVLNFSGHSHPVGLSYYLALLIKLFHSDSEWLLRGGFIIFPLVYAVAGYHLARRFTKYPLLTSLLMMVAPAVLVFSPTLMPDIPMTSFWLLSVLAFLAGEEERKFSKIVLAGLGLIIATLISYQAIVMSGLLAVYAWVRGERRFKIYACLALPIVFLGVYWCAGKSHYGFWAAKRGAQFLSFWNIFGLDYFRQKVMGMFSTLGATTIFFPLLLWVFKKSEGWKRLFLLLAVALATCFLLPNDYSLLEYAEYFFFASGGLAWLWFVVRILGRGLKEVSSQNASAAVQFFLTLWILVVVVYTIVLCEFSAARYLAALTPPLAILFVIQVERLSGLGKTKPTKVLGATAFATWVVAMLVAFADYQYVGCYRDFSKWFSQKYASAPGTVWVGTEAGLRYYMQQEGARTLINPYGPTLPGVLPGSAWGEEHFGRPRVNDLLVRPASFLRYDVALDLELSPVIDAKTLTSAFPVRTYGRTSHAGLHGTNVGLLPFAISWAALDQIEISQYNIFAAAFADAKRNSRGGEHITPLFFSLEGSRRAVIALPPGSELSYSLQIPSGTHLKGSWGYDDKAPRVSDCKPGLTVNIKKPGDPPETIFTCQAMEMISSSSPAILPRKSIDCDLRPLGGQFVALTFRNVSLELEGKQCPTLGLWNLQFSGTVPLTR